MYFPVGASKMKVLVICGKTIGEVVFSTPVIRALKVQIDDVVLHGLFASESAFLLDENPYLDKIHLEDPSHWKTWQNLKSENFDIVVNLRTDQVSRMLTTFLAPETYVRDPNDLRNWLMVNFKINKLQNVHLTDQMLKTIEPLGVKADELGLDYFIPDKDKVSLDWLPEPFRKGYIAFPIAAPYATRKLPVDKIIELCDKINRPIVLLGTKHDAENGKVIQSFFDRSVSITWEEGLLELNKRTTIFDACGKFNFNQMASIIKQSNAVFAFDGDFIPVASALKKEIFGLWGNTILLFGRYPYRTRFTVLESNSVMCRPCSSKGFDECPKGHFRCMRDIRFDFYMP